MNTLFENGILLAADMEPRLFDLDLQLLADSVLMIIAVFALFLIASKLLFNPVREMMQKRQEKIKTELDTAASKLEEAAALKAEYRDKLKNVDREAEEILSETRKKALAGESRIVEQAREEAAAIVKRAREEAELEKRKAADDVKREMVLVASMMAGKIAAASMDEEKQRALIDDTLKEIGESTWRS